MQGSLLRPEEAVSLATTHARTLGLDVRRGDVLRCGHNVMIRLQPCGVVVRVTPTATAERIREVRSATSDELDVVRFLAAREAGVVPPVSIVEPGPHVLDSAVLTYWTDIAPSGQTDPRDAGRALAACHALLRDSTISVRRDPSPPRFAHTLFVELLDQGVVDAARGRRIARANVDALERVSSLGLPEQVVHGDAHLENVLTRGRAALWSDWEDTFRGPCEWDLACLVATAQVTGADRARTELALAGYGIDRLGPSVALLVRVRAFQVATWLLAGSARLGAPSDQAEPWLTYVEGHRHRGPRRLARLVRRAWPF